MTWTLVAAAAAAAAAAGAAARADTVLHVGPRNTNAAYVFEWLGERAVVVATQGRVGASVGGRGATRIATLDAPYTSSYVTSDPDCPGADSEVRHDVLKLAVVRLSGSARRGSSKVVDIGTDTTLSGCNAGRVVPFGSPTDEGVVTRHLAAELRPSMADLTPGTVLAGPSEDADVSLFPSADLVGFSAGNVTFQASGRVYAQSVVDGWLVLDLGGGQRGYTRFAVDANGAETWIAADWSAGVPTAVYETTMVKPAAGAGFGGTLRASRLWESGVYVGTNTPFYFDLYRDGTGSRVSKDLAEGTETRMPVTWGFEGTDLVTRRPVGSSGTVARRQWVPLRNSGSTRFVMESETRIQPDGSSELYVRPRVNFYVNEGPGTPPAAP
ncbi:hypothetical protein CKO44_09475 [Rubrivivax gelatinosus]|uniref:Uncharacterized protein n=1 Tax=Rubrivivax gelatinosus TaxID=28068 RepID=A0ABS1DUP6_RUBGE|nr:hypothetical protein [Rubrivivax gelatinosus]MBK1712925.1 hypothetical protein [Rubrivivax gelatinosus]